MKALRIILFVLVMAGAVSGATDYKIIVDIRDKTVTATNLIAILETVPTKIINLDGADPEDLILRIMDRDGTTMALAESFTGDVTNAYGNIDLNTSELTNYFSGGSAQSIKHLNLGVWDTGQNILLANDRIEIQNNPYLPWMAGPSPVGTSYLIAERTGEWSRAYSGTNFIAVLLPFDTTMTSAEFGYVPQYNANGLFSLLPVDGLVASATNVAWGNVLGTISDQTDLWAYLTNSFTLLNANSWTADWASISGKLDSNHWAGVIQSNQVAIALETTNRIAGDTALGVQIANESNRLDAVDVSLFAWINSNYVDILVLQGLGGSNQVAIASNDVDILVLQGLGWSNQVAIASNDVDILLLQGLGLSNQTEIATKLDSNTWANSEANTNVIFRNGDTISAGITNLQTFYAQRFTSISNTVLGVSDVGIGGAENWVDGLGCGLLGGFSNGLWGTYASIIGGYQNINTGSYGNIIIGGANNETVGGTFNTIISGYANYINGTYGNVIAGGINHEIKEGAYYSFIGGGDGNGITSSWDAVIAGGNGNRIITAFYSFIGAGQNNKTVGGSASVVGGTDNTAGTGAFIGGGYQNYATRTGSVVGGNTNRNYGVNGIIGGGMGNIIDAGSEYSGILCGRSNYVDDASDYSVIMGGISNYVDGNYSGVMAGYGNRVTGNYSVVLSGKQNDNQGDYSSIVGGLDNFIDTPATYSTILNGRDSVIRSNYCVVGGRKGRAYHDGNTIFTDSQDSYLDSTNKNMMLLRFQNGYILAGGALTADLSNGYNFPTNGINAYQLGGLDYTAYSLDSNTVHRNGSTMTKGLTNNVGYWGIGVGLTGVLAENIDGTNLTVSSGDFNAKMYVPAASPQSGVFGVRYRVGASSVADATMYAQDGGAYDPSWNMGGLRVSGVRNPVATNDAVNLAYLTGGSFTSHPVPTGTVAYGGNTLGGVGNLLPETANTSDIGSTNLYFKDIYASTGTWYFVNEDGTIASSMSVGGGTTTFSGVINAPGADIPGVSADVMISVVATQNTTLTSSSTADLYIPITNGVVTYNRTGVPILDGNCFDVQTNDVGYYKVDMDGSFSTDKNSAHVINVHMARVNGQTNLADNIGMSRTISSTAIGSFSGSGIIRMGTNDCIQPYISTSASGGEEITFEHFAVILEKVGEL